MEQIIHIADTTSTSDTLLELVKSNKQLAEGTMVCADFQTNGRGQASNKWESERGKNLLFSILTFPDFIRPSQQFLISQAASLAVVDFLSLCCGLKDIKVKWPNDIYCGDGKICGMLIETSLLGANFEYAIAGVGININQTEFFSNAPNPVSVCQLNGKIFNLDICAVQMHQFYMARYMQLCNGEYDSIRQEYKKMLYWNDGQHRYCDADGEFDAEIADVKDSGVLVLKTSDGNLREYWHKEVEFMNHK